MIKRSKNNKLYKIKNNNFKFGGINENEDTNLLINHLLNLKTLINIADNASVIIDILKRYDSQLLYLFNQHNIIREDPLFSIANLITNIHKHIIHCNKPKILKTISLNNIFNAIQYYYLSKLSETPQYLYNIRSVYHLKNEDYGINIYLFGEVHNINNVKSDGIAIDKWLINAIENSICFINLFVELPFMNMRDKKSVALGGDPKEDKSSSNRSPIHDIRLYLDNECQSKYNVRCHFNDPRFYPHTSHFSIKDKIFQLYHHLSPKYYNLLITKFASNFNSFFLYDKYAINLNVLNDSILSNSIQLLQNFCLTVKLYLINNSVIDSNYILMFNERETFKYNTLLLSYISIIISDNKFNFDVIYQIYSSFFNLKAFLGNFYFKLLKQVKRCDILFKYFNTTDPNQILDSFLKNMYKLLMILHLDIPFGITKLSTNIDNQKLLTHSLFTKLNIFKYLTYFIPSQIYEHLLDLYSVLRMLKTPNNSLISEKDALSINNKKKFGLNLSKNIISFAETRHVYIQCALLLILVRFKIIHEQDDDFPTSPKDYVRIHTNNLHLPLFYKQVL